ncbi:MAG: MBOAT family O-acyltransferase [Oscillospiraceae bacterium]
MALRRGMRPANLLRLLGYSDMAVGLGRIFGFHFPENFRYPFLSGSVTEFWRRWHISLGSWFRDYVYIPLGAAAAPQPVATERVPCLGPDGPVARGGVEFRAVGPVFRRPAGGGKAVVRPRAEKTRLLKHLYMLPCWR